MFSNKEVTKDELNSLFEAARWAASSNNLQPWRFMYAYKGSKTYDKMYDCLAEFNQGWIVHAPVLIFTAIKENNPDGNKNFHALHDLGLAMGNLSIQAQAMDIAVHQMAGLDWKKAEKVFDVPEGYHIVSAVSIGHYGGDVEDLKEKYQDGEVEDRSRKAHNEIVKENAWPEWE